jgi:hypothetical protein
MAPEIPEKTCCTNINPGWVGVHSRFFKKSALIISKQSLFQYSDFNRTVMILIVNIKQLKSVLPHICFYITIINAKAIC